MQVSLTNPTLCCYCLGKNLSSFARSSWVECNLFPVYMTSGEQIVQQRTTIGGSHLWWMRIGICPRYTNGIAGCTTPQSSYVTIPVLIPMWNADKRHQCNHWAAIGRSFNVDENPSLTLVTSDYNTTFLQRQKLNRLCDQCKIPVFIMKSYQQQLKNIH